MYCTNNCNESPLCSYEWAFFDVAKVNVKGGDGGDGCMAIRREFRVAMGGPSGGRSDAVAVWSVWSVCSVSCVLAADCCNGGC